LLWKFGWGGALRVLRGALTHFSVN